MKDQIALVLVTVFLMVMFSLLIITLVFFGPTPINEHLPTICFIFGIYLGTRIYLTFKK